MTRVTHDTKTICPYCYAEDKYVNMAPYVYRCQRCYKDFLRLPPATGDYVVTERME